MKGLKTGIALNKQCYLKAKYIVIARLHYEFGRLLRQVVNDKKVARIYIFGICR